MELPQPGGVKTFAFVNFRQNSEGGLGDVERHQVRCHSRPKQHFVVIQTV